MSSVDRVEASRKARPSSAATIAKLMIPFEVVGKLTIVDGSIAPTHFFEDLIHIMSGLSHDIAAMVANHAAGDEDGFYAVALDVAHRELSEGRRNAATEIRKAIEQARGEAVELQSGEEDDLGVDVDSEDRKSVEEGRSVGGWIVVWWG